MAKRETTVVRWGAMDDAQQSNDMLKDEEKLAQFEKMFFKEKYRYTFFWWGDKQKVPATFPPCTAVPLKQVDCGGKHFIALSELGQVFTWGNGGSGQLGHGHKCGNRKEPTLVEYFQGKEVARVYGSGAQSAAFTSKKELFTWGWIGGNVKEIVWEPQECVTLKEKDILQVCLGIYHRAALVAGNAGTREVYTWGTNKSGQLGHGDLDERKEPCLVAALSDSQVLSLAAGEQCTAAISLYGDVFMWGLNEDGVLGVQSKDDIVNTPKIVSGFEGVTVTKVACGYRSTAAISDIGEVFTWGKNSEGQLGLGNTDEYEPLARKIKKFDGYKIVGAASGHNHMVAWTSNGHLFSWGSNRNDRLGLDSEFPFVTSPTLVDSLNGRAIFDLTCGSRSVVACIGLPLFGQPLASLVNEATPTPAVFYECVKFLHNHVSEEGLFRVAGSGRLKKLVRSWWDAGYYVHMDNCQDPHLVASLLKNFLSELPDPLLTYKLHDQFVALESDSLDCFQRVEGLRILVAQLPVANMILLRELLFLLFEVNVNRKISKMDCKNLATVFAPTILRPHPSTMEFAKDIRLQIKLTKKLIKYAYAIFTSNTVDMLSNMCMHLVDVQSTPQQRNKVQEKYWSVLANRSKDQTVGYALPSGNPGTFAQVISDSRVLSMSIQSALMDYPSDGGRTLFESMFGGLDQMTPGTVTAMVEGLTFAKLSPEHRLAVAELICSHRGNGKQCATMAGNIARLPADAYQGLDESLSAAMQRLEEQSQELIVAEGERLSALQSTGISTAGPAVQAILDQVSTAADTQQDVFIMELDLLQKQLESFRLTGATPESTALAAELDALQARQKSVVETLSKQRKILDNQRATLGSFGERDSVAGAEQQRMKDELEGLDININRKLAAKERHDETVSQFNDFFARQLVPNIARLREMKVSASTSVASVTGEGPSLLDKYFEMSAQLLSDLKKKMSRVKKDLKKMARNYGESVVAPIQLEYDKVKEICFDLIEEWEVVDECFKPTVKPAVEWRDFCVARELEPKAATMDLVKEFVESVQHVTLAEAHFTVRTLTTWACFDMLPKSAEKLLKELSGSMPGVVVVSLDTLLERREKLDEMSKTLSKRHGAGAA